MIDMIRGYLADEFECDVADGSDAGGTTDRVLTFNFRDITYTVVVTDAFLRDPPPDLLAFLTDREDTLADIVVLADGQPVVVEPTGFRVVEASTSRVL